MKQYLKSIRTALFCFLAVILLNFLLLRMLPGDPVAYLSGFAEEEMTAAKVEYYRNALHLDESLPMQFVYYIRSLLDGTLGYSFKKEAVVSSLIGERLGYTLQITLPSVILSTVLGLVWGLSCGIRSGSLKDRLSGSLMMILNAVPTFVTALALVILFCFRNRLLPYTGVSSAGMAPGEEGFLADRLRHQILPVGALTLSMLPSRFLLMRNTAAAISHEKYVLYARQRGLSESAVRFGYVFKNIAQPFITMVGMSVSLCIGGSLVIENIFSINGMGRLLTDAVYTLDYPLMQGILFVTTFIMLIAVIVSDLICILIDPKVRRGDSLA